MRRFMFIRIKDPEPSKWRSIKKKRNIYYVVKHRESGSSKFITLDIGDLLIPGIQGMALVRGVPRYKNRKIGDKVSSNDFVDQSIRIELRKIGSSDDDPPRVQVEKLMKSKYRGIIIDYFQKRGKRITGFEVKPKREGDFKLTFIR